jgi:hypothetical protein
MRLQLHLKTALRLRRVKRHLNSVSVTSDERRCERVVAGVDADHELVGRTSAAPLPFGGARTASNGIKRVLDKLSLLMVTTVDSRRHVKVCCLF